VGRVLFVMMLGLEHRIYAYYIIYLKTKTKN